MQACSLQLYYKKDSSTGAFSVNFGKFFRKPFFEEHLRWLLLLFASLQHRSKYYEGFSELSPNFALILSELPIPPEIIRNALVFS